MISLYSRIAARGPEAWFIACEEGESPILVGVNVEAAKSRYLKFVQTRVTVAFDDANDREISKVRSVELARAREAKRSAKKLMSEIFKDDLKRMAQRSREEQCRINARRKRDTDEYWERWMLRNSL